MTMLTSAVDTEQANRIASSGWATKGDLIVWRRDNTLWKVIKARNVKYLAMDTNGREMLLPFRGCIAPPAGTVWHGAEKSASEERREAQAAEEGEIRVLDSVWTRSQKFPGEYVVVKFTTRDKSRVKVQLKGGSEWDTLTGPVTSFTKVDPTS